MNRPASAGRDTRQKRAIRAAFERAGRPLTADEARDSAARASKGLGLATVYRTIRALLEDGWLASVDVPGRGAFFEVAGKRHHHHFACESCGGVFELSGCAAAHIRLPAGFRGSRHDVTVFGTCERCTRAAR